VKKLFNKKIIIFMLAGGVVGFVVSLVYQSFGLSCTLMCNPTLTVVVGLAVGAVIAKED